MYVCCLRWVRVVYVMFPTWIVVLGSSSMSRLTGERMTERPDGDTPKRFTPGAGRATIRNVRPWLSASIRKDGRTAGGLRSRRGSASLGQEVKIVLKKPRSPNVVKTHPSAHRNDTCVTAAHEEEQSQPAHSNVCIYRAADQETVTVLSM